MTSKIKMMVTVATVIVAAGATCGCSSVPSGASGQLTSGRAAPAGAWYTTATSPAVVVPGEQRVVGADPDPNVRLDLNRNSTFHLHGGGN
jgi:hypothetical protein